MHFRLNDARLKVWNANPTPVMSVEESRVCTVPV